jgi:hypothetical protein
MPLFWRLFREAMEERRIIRLEHPIAGRERVGKRCAIFTRVVWCVTAVHERTTRLPAPGISSNSTRLGATALSHAHRSQSLEDRHRQESGSMVVMGRYIPNILPLLLEIETKEAQLRAQESEYAQVLSRLEGLDVSDATKAIFQRYVIGKLTIKELNTAIDEYVNLKARTGTNGLRLRKLTLCAFLTGGLALFCPAVPEFVSAMASERRAYAIVESFIPLQTLSIQGSALRTSDLTRRKRYDSKAP